MSKTSYQNNGNGRQGRMLAGLSACVTCGILACVLLSGCGIKGSLTLPDEPTTALTSE